MWLYSARWKHALRGHMLFLLLLLSFSSCSNQKHQAETALAQTLEKRQKHL